MRECGVAQAYELGELCSGNRRAWSRGFIRTLSLFFFSGVAWPAPSYPVLTYSTYLRDSFTPKAIALTPQETSISPEMPSSIRQLRRAPFWWSS